MKKHDFSLMIMFFSDRIFGICPEVRLMYSIFCVRDASLFLSYFCFSSLLALLSLSLIFFDFADLGPNLKHFYSLFPKYDFFRTFWLFHMKIDDRTECVYDLSRVRDLGR